MRYGTLPIVRYTGGAADTVVDAANDGRIDRATGFSFNDISCDALTTAARRAVASFRLPLAWCKIQSNAMSADFGWKQSAEAYAIVTCSAVTPKCDRAASRC